MPTPRPNRRATRQAAATIAGIGGKTPASRLAPAKPAAAPAAAPVFAPTPPAPQTPIDQTAEGKSAKAALTGALTQYGLQALGDWAWNQYVAGTPTEQIMLDLRNTPEYKQRFAGMEALSKNGRAISEQQYIDLERGYAQTLHNAGLPASFYDDPTDFAKLIGNDVSPQEFQDRVTMAQQTALASPEGQQMRDQLSRLYGIPNAIGAVTAYWLDPDKASNIIKTQFTSAQLAKESATTGFGSLNVSQAEKLANAGVSVDQARQGFTSLAGMGQFQQGLAGDSGDQGVTQDEMLGAAFTGDAAAQQKLATTARRRVAAFEGGGGFSAGQSGVSGLGSASR